MIVLRKLLPNRPDVFSQTRFCSNCGKELGRLERMTAGDRNRCRDCARQFRDKLRFWRDSFVESCRDGLLSMSEWDELRRHLEAEGVPEDEGVEFVRDDALRFAERSFAFAKADGQLEEDEEDTIRWLIEVFGLANLAPYLLEEVAYLSRLRRISEGNLPTVTPSVVLPAGEVCHFEGSCSYHKVNRSNVVQVPGSLIVTNRRIIFSAPSGGGEVPLGKVLRITEHTTGFFLELSRKANSGFYSVQDPRLTATIMLAAVRIATRQIIAPGDRDTRHIPQHLKIAVWQRDQGQCVQCKASEYLEFDHIIPYSKGGASSLNNVQLLCRKCNLQKGDSL